MKSISYLMLITGLSASFLITAHAQENRGLAHTRVTSAGSAALSNGGTIGLPIPSSAETDTKRTTPDTVPVSTVGSPSEKELRISGSLFDHSDLTKKESRADVAMAAGGLSAPPTELYRVGTGDVLDIHVVNATTRESTLFTVTSGGFLEYPPAGDPLEIEGLTTAEIVARLSERIKSNHKPELVVRVREYASHTVLVSGLVLAPGPRVLRREAVPLYVLLAETQPRPEAARATIIRNGAAPIQIDLANLKASSELVFPGDVITFSAAPPAAPQFYYVGGQIVLPGQKDFHEGLTLTQAILAAGGTMRDSSGRVRISRQGPDGRLKSTEYNVKQIEQGEIPDPALEAGDRLEIGRPRR